MSVFKTTFDLLEDAIVTQLGPMAAAGIEVIPMPETDPEKDEAFENPRITVMYTNSEYDDQPIKGNPKSFSTSEVSQMEYANISLNIQSRKLRGTKGVHALKEDVEKLLLGFRPNKAWSRMFLKSNDHVHQKDNVWYYVLMMVTSRPLVQHMDDESTNIPNTDNAGLIATGNGVLLNEVILNVNASE